MTRDYFYCAICAADGRSGLAANNIAASVGERSYRCAVNVPARTVHAHRVPQGNAPKHVADDDHENTGSGR